MRNLLKTSFVFIIIILGVISLPDGLLASTHITSHNIPCNLAGDTTCSGADLNAGCVAPIGSSPGNCGAFCNEGETATCVSGGTWQCIIPSGSNSYAYSSSFPSSCGGLPAGTPCQECQRPSSCSCATAPQCNISSFTASSYTPTLDSSINLSFSLSNPASQTWTLTRSSAPAGANSFSPITGTNSSANPSSGTLNVCGTYSYNLSCGSSNSGPIGVIVPCTALNASAVAKHESNNSLITSATITGTSGTNANSGSATGSYKVELNSANFINPSGITWTLEDGSSVFGITQITNLTNTGTYSITTRDSSGQSVTARVTVNICLPPTISSVQGYDANTGQFTATVYANNSGQTNRYIILYGTFASSGNTVTVGGVSLTITYQSSTQINAVMNTSTGSKDVVVTNSCGTSNTVNTTVSSPPAPPSAPTITVTTSSSCGGKISISWGAVTGATSYKVYRNNSLVTTVTSTSYTDTGLTPGAIYSYKVRAVNANGESADSNTASATASATCGSPPPIPTGLNVTTSSSCGGRINISWNNTTNASSYRLYRDGGATPIYNGSNTSYTDTGLSPGSTHTYKIQAVNSFGASAQSASSVAVVASGACVSPPSAPVISTATGACGGRVNISWDAVTNATSYKVYRDGGATAIGTTAGTSYTDSGLVSGTSYSYKVRASNSAGDSALSNNSSAVASGSCSATAVFTALPATLTYNAKVNDTPPSQIITLTNTGDQGLNIVPNETISWFNLSGANASGCFLNPAGQFGDSCTVVANVASQSTANIYNGTLTYSATNIPGVPVRQVTINYTVTPGGSIPPAPTGQSATPICDNRIDVNWNPSSGATSYELYAYRSENLITPVHTNTSVASNNFIFSATDLGLIGTGGGSQTAVFTASGSWVAPTGVTSVSAEVWGAGGGGGFNSGQSNNRGAEGGGGGAYSKKNSITVIPGNSYTVVVGTTNGADSYFINTTTVLAKGGAAGSTFGSALGGQASAGVGDIKYSGGNSGSATNYSSTGGGGAAGASGNGGNSLDDSALPVPGQGGTGGTGGGGKGGGGGTRTLSGWSEAGHDGDIPGGGGGGMAGEWDATDGWDSADGDGARGEVRITYTLPPIDANTLYQFRIKAKNSTGTSGFSGYTSPAVKGGTWECETSLPPTNYDLVVVQNGRGTVTSSPAGINCPTATCVANFEENTSVILTASCNVSPQWIFAGWGADCASLGIKTGPTTGTCTININGPKTVTTQCLPDANYKEF